MRRRVSSRFPFLGSWKDFVRAIGIHRETWREHQRG